jgi:hypothetical protein
MGGWETVLAALGGLLLGMGLGMGLGRGRERAVVRRLDEHARRLRRVVVPLLEEHADELGLPEADRCRNTDDPLEVTVQLSAAIREHERPSVLPFSDTIQAPRSSISTDDETKK